MLYEKDFEFFLAHTNEKEILKNEILNLFKKYNIESVLDIGAGNGLLSIPLSKKVENYLAIEPKVKFCEALRKKGLRVIESFFPINLAGKFDFILCSHSVPEEGKNYIPFLSYAWEKVSDKGNLLMITYGQKHDDWNKLIRDLNLQSFKDHYKKGIERYDFLKTFAEVDVKKVRTQVKTHSLNQMIRALSFVASAGQIDKKEKFLAKKDKLKRILNGKYFDSSQDLYTFPFNHYFFRIQK